MIEKLTPDQLKAVFDLSDTSDVTRVDRTTAHEKMGCCVGPYVIRLLKHYHPELFKDPRLEAAKKLAREILAEEYERNGLSDAARYIKDGGHDANAEFKLIVRALLMDLPTKENQDDQ